VHAGCQQQDAPYRLLAVHQRHPAVHPHAVERRRPCGPEQGDGPLGVLVTLDRRAVARQQLCQDVRVGAS
jgi:hypothetical protein